MLETAAATGEEGLQQGRVGRLGEVEVALGRERRGDVGRLSSPGRSRSRSATRQPVIPGMARSSRTMPGASGDRVAAALRDASGGRPVVLVAVTGFPAPATRARCEAAGFDHFLPEPPDLAELRALLACVTDRRGARQAPGGQIALATARPAVRKYRSVSRGKGRAGVGLGRLAPAVRAAGTRPAHRRRGHSGFSGPGQEMPDSSAGPPTPIPL